MAKLLLLKALSVASLCTALSSCGGGGSGDTPTNPSPNPNPNPLGVVDYDGLSKADVEAAVLERATADTLERHLKNGIRLNVRANTQFRLDNNGMAPVQPTTAGSDSEFSPTNTHVRGVDESDFVKYDGLYIYMVSEPEYIWGRTPPDAAIRILQTDPINAGVSEIASIPLNNDEWGEVSELYLLGDQSKTDSLITLRSSWSNIASAEPFFSDAAFDIFPIPQRDKVQLSAYDLSQPSAPQQNYTLEIDGYLQASRKIGDTVYLLTQYSPYLPFIDFYIANEDQAKQNEAKIAELSLQDLLPKVSINGGEEQALVGAADCLLPVNTEANKGFLNIVTLVAVDMAKQEISSAKCFNGRVQGVYASGENIYIGGSQPRINGDAEALTVVHKFALDAAIDYRATAIVPGYLGWTDPSFYMDEHDGFFRIVTSTNFDADGNFERRHRLSVLEESADSNNMTLVARLPNDENPNLIGKPGEDIYAVRFMGERAYIVTFERIDPLYVIDLSDPRNPSIAGELEVPGFSNYLHPVGEHYLLGLGRDADENGVEQGLKVSLFDISNIAAPSLIGSQSIGDRGTWTSALYDLRALSFLAPSDDQLRFAFPVSSYGFDFDWEEEGLHLMEINGLENNNASLSAMGKITAEQRSDDHRQPRFTGTDRSILHNDSVFYIHGNSVWAAMWSSPENASGPH